MNIQNEKKKQMFYGSFIVIECALWGLGNVLTKIALESISPFFCLALRFLLAFLVLAVMFRKSAFQGMTKRMLRDCIIIGVFTALFFIFGTLGLFLTTATAAGFFMSIAVLFTPFLSFIFLKKSIDKKIYLVILIVLIGAYFLCVNSGTFTFGAGELLAIGCSFVLALQLIFTSKYVCDIGVKMLSTMQCGVASVVCFIFAFILESPADLVNVEPIGWIGVVYLAIGCSAITYILQNVALEHISAVFASLAFCTEPIFTAIFAFIMLGEYLTLKGVIGCGLIMVGLLLASFINEKGDSEKEMENTEKTEKDVDKGNIL